MPEDRPQACMYMHHFSYLSELAYRVVVSLSYIFLTTKVKSKITKYVAGNLN